MKVGYAAESTEDKSNIRTLSANHTLTRRFHRCAASISDRLSFQECCHVEFHRAGGIGVLSTDWTGSPGETAARSAVRPMWACHMHGAGCDGIVLRRDRAHRAGRETRLGGAVIAGMVADRHPGERDLAVEQQCRPIGVPEAECRMDQDAKGRGSKRFRPLGPSLERMPGRMAEREQRRGG